MTVRIFPGFLTPEECAAIAEHTRQMRPHLMPNPVSPHRYFRALADLPVLSNEIRQIEYRVWDITGFTSAERDRAIPHYLSVNEPGGAVHLHTDPGLDECVNTRFNLMIDKPTGGEPVVDDEIVPAQAGDAWVFIATKHSHRSLPVIRGWRIVVSYGFQIPFNDDRLASLGLQ